MTKQLHRKLIYDPMQRVLHWWIAACTIGLVVTGVAASRMSPGTEQAYMWSWHIKVGNILLIGVLGRLLWGFIGPEHARFSALFHVKKWFQFLKHRRMESADGDFGHHPQASISYLGFYFLIVGTVASGLCLAGMLHGEGLLGDLLLDELTYAEALRLFHEYAWIALIFFVVTHVGALIFHEKADKIPISQSMISGFQYRTVKEPKHEKSNS